MYIIAIVAAACAVLVTGVLAAALNVAVWWAEIVLSVAPYVFGVAGILLAIATLSILIGRRKQVSGQAIPLTLLSCALIGLVGVAGLVFVHSQHTVRAQQQPGETKTLRFAAFNKLYSNTQYDDIVGYVSREHIDVLVVEEVTRHELTDMANRLGYQSHLASQAADDLHDRSTGIISRLPLANAGGTDLYGAYSIVHAEVTPTGGKPLVVMGVHAMVPSTPEAYTQRSAHLDTIAKQIHQQTRPVIVGGDFNTTVYSSELQDFNRQLQDTVRTTTPQLVPPCSWNSPVLFFCLRIDHVYIPTSATLQSLRIGPHLGSDHHIVIADIRL